MIEKKYTIFVSSTYTDLIEERRIVIEAIVAAGHIPIAMEYFTAGNQEQFEFIKPLIDKSDYYILIVAGKYGTISEETNKSYTEMEYDYAIKKGVPVASFLLTDHAIKKRASEDVDIEKKKIKKLADFRRKISAKKMCRFFSDQTDLAYWIRPTIDDLIKLNDRPGWIRTTDINLDGEKNLIIDEHVNLAKDKQYFKLALQEIDPERAIKYYDSCIRLNTYFAEAYNNRGYLKYRKGEFESAIKDFKKAIDIKKDYAEAYNNLGVILFIRGKYKPAEDNFKLAGKYAEAKLNLGLLSYAQGDIDGAKKCFDEAMALKPNFAVAYYTRALFNFSIWGFSENDIENIKKAKEINLNVIDNYPNRELLTGKMEEWDNCFYEVDYSSDYKSLISVSEGKIGVFRIPDCVTVIGASAFEGCRFIKSIVVPNRVTEIRYNAFCGCFSLESIVIPYSVTEIGSQAFMGCFSLTEIHIKSPSKLLNDDVLYQLDEYKITLYVPKNLVEQYRKHYPPFKEIIEE